jgi:hypothetical protein
MHRIHPEKPMMTNSPHHARRLAAAIFAAGALIAAAPFERGTNALGRHAGDGPPTTPTADR